VTSISAFVCSNFKCFKRLLVERKNTEPAKNKKKIEKKNNNLWKLQGKAEGAGQSATLEEQRWREEEKGTEHSLKPAIASLSRRSAVSRQTALVLVFVSVQACISQMHVFRSCI